MRDDPTARCFGVAAVAALSGGDLVPMGVGMCVAVLAYNGHTDVLELLESVDGCSLDELAAKLGFIEETLKRLGRSMQASAETGAGTFSDILDAMTAEWRARDEADG